MGISFTALSLLEGLGPPAFGVSVAGSISESLAKAVDKPWIRKPIEVLAKTVQSSVAGVFALFGMGIIYEERNWTVVDFQYGFLAMCVVAPLVLEIGKAFAQKYNCPRVDTIFSYTVKGMNVAFGVASLTLAAGPVGGIVGCAIGISSLVLPLGIARKSVTISKIEV